MKRESKILIGMMITLVVVLSLMGSVLAIRAYNRRLNEESGLSQSQNQTEMAAIAKWLFNKLEPVTINGTVVTHFKNTLVIDSGGKRLNILLPPVWNVNSQVINASEIFNGNYVEVGDTVTIKALQVQITNKQGVTITFILAYEIIDGANHFYAILPFNISP